MTGIQRTEDQSLERTEKEKNCLPGGPARKYLHLVLSSFLSGIWQSNYELHIDILNPNSSHLCLMQLLLILESVANQIVRAQSNSPRMWSLIHGVRWSDTECCDIWFQTIPTIPSGSSGPGAWQMECCDLLWINIYSLHYSIRKQNILNTLRVQKVHWASMKCPIPITHQRGHKTLSKISNTD